MREILTLEALMSIITAEEMTGFRDRACDRYVKSVLECTDTIHKDRETLFYLARAEEELKYRELTADTQDTTGNENDTTR